MTTVKVIRRKTKGGPGSGNWGHAGRPGLHGGSAPGGGKGSVLEGDAATKSPKLERKWRYGKRNLGKDAGGNTIGKEVYNSNFYAGGNNLSLEVSTTTVNGDKLPGYSASVHASPSLGYHTMTPGFKPIQGNFETPLDAMLALEKYVSTTYKDRD